MFLKPAKLAAIALTVVLTVAGCNTLETSGPSDAVNAGASGYIVTLKLSAADTSGALERRYGGRMLAFEPDAGFAMLLAEAEPPKGDGAVKHVQKNGAVSAPEVRLSTNPAPLAPQDNNSGMSGTGSWASGWTSWAESWTAWAGGWTSWATGTSSTLPDAPSQNLAAWNQINLFEAHRVSRKFGAGVKVAVVDTGVDLAHPMFQGRLAPQGEWRDFVDNDTNPQEAGNNGNGNGNGYGHGTAVAGIVLQVAPSATILPIRVLRRDGDGDTATVVAGISYAVGAGAQIINVSIGTDGYDQSLYDIAAYAASKGVRIVASAGNNGKKDGMTSPGMFTWYSTSIGSMTMGIGSVNASDVRSSFSAYGNNLWSYAPGESIWSAYPGNQAANFTGTSFAAPIVSGALALAYGELSNPESRSGVHNQLWSSLDWPASSKYLGTDGSWKGGRLNLGRFIKSLPGWKEPTDIQPGTYRLVNQNSGKCLDVTNGYLDDGMKVQQWTCHEGMNQRWRIEKIGSNYRLTAVHSGKVLDVTGASVSDGTPLQQWTWGQVLNQQWGATWTSTGVFEFRAAHSGKCLDVPGSSLSDGVVLQQWTCNATGAQRWRLEARF